MSLRGSSAELAVGLLALVAFAASIVISWDELPTVVSGNPVLVVLALLVIVLGEAGEVRLPSGRRLAPGSLSMGLVLATVGAIHGHPDFHVKPAAVVVIYGLGQCVTYLVAPSKRYHPGSSSARLIGIAVAAILVRRHYIGEHAFWEWQMLPSYPHAQVAAGLLFICAVGLAVERCLAGVIRAQRMHTRVGTALRDELEEALPLTLALIAPAPIATLAAPVIGVLAIPLALAPALVVYFAMRRSAVAGKTFAQTVRSLSRLTEEGGYTPRRHAERVAELTRLTSLRMGLSAREVRDAEFAALLHDLGQLGLRAAIPGGATVLAAPSDQLAIARQGAAVIGQNPELHAVADLVERHTTPFRSVVEAEGEVPLASRVLKVTNAFDDLTGGRRSQQAIRSAIERIHLGLGYEYDPAVVAVLEQVLDRRWPAES